MASFHIAQNAFTMDRLVDKKTTKTEPSKSEYLPDRAAQTNPFAHDHIKRHA